MQRVTLPIHVVCKVCMFDREDFGLVAFKVLDSDPQLCLWVLWKILILASHLVVIVLILPFAACGKVKFWHSLRALLPFCSSGYFPSSPTLLSPILLLPNTQIPILDLDFL